MSAELCGICHVNTAKYKCPKCSVKYCSLICYKDEERHRDPQETSETNSGTEGEEEKRAQSSKEETSLDLTPELKDLLRYNTVKFHLAKVYRILNTNIGDTSDASFNMSTEMKKQLAIDYLNTLRYGGIHYNEAIEEFCQHSLKLVTESV